MAPLKIESFKLSLPGIIELTFLNYGGIIQSLLVPDHKGEMGDVVLGLEQKEQYLCHHPYLGGIIGRFANRIKKASFVIDQNTYALSRNEGKNCLHGGKEGLDKKIWDVEKIDGTSFKLSYTSRHLDQGFPGNLRIEVIYKITIKRELIIVYKAKTDEKTFVNFTNHSYFNLAMNSESILNHKLQIKADQYVEVDRALIPTGELNECKGPYDFRFGRILREVIPDILEGIDLTYVLDIKKDWAAQLYHPQSGRELTIFTTEPGLQVYTGHLLNASVVGKEGKRYEKYQGICLEPQHFPDAPHHANFPTTLLVPEKTFQSQTIYRFRTC